MGHKSIILLSFAFVFFTVLAISNTFHLNYLSTNEDSKSLTIENLTRITGFPVKILEFKLLLSDEKSRTPIKVVSERATDTHNTLEHNEFLEDENNQSQMKEDSKWMTDPGEIETEDLKWEYSNACTTDDAMDNVCVSVGKQLNGAEYPKRLRIRRAAELDETDNDYHDEDESRNCKVRKDLKTVEILCVFRPTTSICKSYCVYGHTYSDGIVRTQSCNENSGKWSLPFEECKPFVDCSLKLSGGGTLKCVSHHVKKPSRCSIACDWDDIDNGVPPEEYVCKLDGSWSPPLPFCAELKGLPLVKAPKIKEYSNLTFPY